jgi:hypothetical protein
MPNQPHNRLIHTISLTLNRLGDGLVDPKLVLAWLLTSLGAGAFWIGLLVPLREAGALLPQLFTASRLRFVPVRKWWWVFGAMVQAVAVAGMVLTALTLTGAAAGAAIATLVAIFAVARSISSVSYKDVLGKTVEKSSRGAVSGAAASIASAGILVFGLVLLFGIAERTIIVISALSIASIMWVLAAITFARLIEEPSVVTADRQASAMRLYLGYLRHDRELQKFLLVRGLLVATAVTPPFLLLLANDSTGGFFAQLGALVIASSFAGFVSGYIWGKLSDYSTALVLALTGIATSITLIGAVAAASTNLYSTIWFLPFILFLIMTMYQGVRIARNIHIVNIAGEDTRAGYTAVSNTIIGVLLLFTGLLGLVAELTSIATTLLILAGMSLAGGLLAFRLKT